MKKRRKMKRNDGSGMTESVPNEELMVSAKVDPEEYAKFVKEHNKKLRRLQREASGDNMEFPDA